MALEVWQASNHHDNENHVSHPHTPSSFTENFIQRQTTRIYRMTCITSACMCISSLWSVFANVRHISSYFFAKSQAWHGRAYQLGKAGIWGFWLFNGGWCLAITGALNVLQSQSWGELRNLRRWWIHMNGAFGTGSRLDGINLRYLGERLILIYYAKKQFF